MRCMLQRTEYPVLYGECAYANESFEGLINELQAVVEGSLDKRTKVKHLILTLFAGQSA